MLVRSGFHSVFYTKHLGRWLFSPRFSVRKGFRVDVSTWTWLKSWTRRVSVLGGAIPEVKHKRFWIIRKPSARICRRFRALMSSFTPIFV